MSARFSGSQTAGDRRRRRIAADEKEQKGEATTDAAALPDGRPLPTRRPTGRFPLRRVVSRSPWKLAAVGLTAFAACGAAVASGYVPAVQAGTYGPGLAALCDPQAGRLAVALGGLLLLAAGQLAWLVRWARARSLRDFRGGYRIWWWTSLALVAAGVVLLTDSHSAVATTLVWLTGRTPLGSDAAYRLAPALAALIILLPSLQRDMRGCRTSRTLVLLAALLWIAGGAAALAGDRVGGVTAQLRLAIPTGAIDVSLLLAGTAAVFTGLLFHARHVVYESVEPPELPARRKKAEAASEEPVTADGDSEKKAKRSSSRRSGRARQSEEREVAKATKPASLKEEKPASLKEEEPQTAPAEEPPKVARPHFVLKDQILKEPPKAAPAPPKLEPVAAKPQPKPEPPKPTPAPVATKPAPPESSDEDDEDMAEIGGRNVRLDGPQDPLRGLSKRERRKLRKEMKHRDHAER